MTILQWNAWIYEKKEHTLELLRSLNPDVVCLQELTIGSTFQEGLNVAEYLADALGYRQFHKPIPNLAPSEGVGDLANAILTRFPITNTDWKWIQEPGNGGATYDDQYRLYLETLLETSIGSLTIGTVHMSYTDRFVPTPKKETEAQKLLSIVGEKRSNYLLTGDFNVTPESSIVQELERQLKNAGPSYDQKTWTTKPFSYNGFDASGLDWRIDYCFTTADVVIKSARTIQTPYSDHLPILIEL